MNDQPWFHKGLRFRCTGCGGCCTGAEGFVWVNKSEVAALAARTHLSVEQFEEQCTRPIGIRRSLVERANGDCVLFDGHSRRCVAYDVRPRQCRTWPFWQSNLRSEETWQEVCKSCPGSGNGPVTPLEQILERVGHFKL
jgi:uncharacterized protein